MRADIYNFYICIYITNVLFTKPYDLIVVIYLWICLASNIFIHCYTNYFTKNAFM